ncbi:MAG: RDD family protein [Leptospirillia bacterium]
MSDEQAPKWISGFWSRVGALFIDAIILGLVGFCLGLLLEDVFVALGGWGRLVGFCIALAYFGMMNSRISNGQTVGKKVLKLRVVNGRNEPVSLARSMTRFSVIGIPFFLNGAQVPTESMPVFGATVLAMVMFGGLASAVYLCAFNRVTRQTLHDLAVGTYVVEARAEQHDVGTVWWPHLVVVTLFFVGVALVPVFTSEIVRNAPFPELIKIRKSFMQRPLVADAGITVGKSIRNPIGDEATESTYINARILLKENRITDAKLAREFVDDLVGLYPSSLEKDVIVINFTYGYDIGIAGRSTNFSHQFKPRVALPPPI